MESGKTVTVRVITDDRDFTANIPVGETYQTGKTREFHGVSVQIVSVNDVDARDDMARLFESQNDLTETVREIRENELTRILGLVDALTPHLSKLESLPNLTPPWRRKATKDE